MGKPKTSTIEKLSDSDLYLVNELLVQCGNLYERTANPPKSGPHSNPTEMDHLKSQLLLLSLKVGERLWYPRGVPSNSTKLSIPSYKRKRR